MTVDFRRVQGILLDVDGTLWRGGDSVPGLMDFFDFLRTSKIGVRIVTNNSLKPPAHYRRKLALFGVTISDDEILTSAQTTGSHLPQTLTPGDLVYVIGEEGLLAAVRAASMTVVQNSAKPVAAVVVVGDRCLTYGKLNDAVLLCCSAARVLLARTPTC